MVLVRVQSVALRLQWVTSDRSTSDSDAHSIVTEQYSIILCIAVHFFRPINTLPLHTLQSLTTDTHPNHPLLLPHLPHLPHLLHLPPPPAAGHAYQLIKRSLTKGNCLHVASETTFTPTLPLTLTLTS